MKQDNLLRLRRLRRERGGRRWNFRELSFSVGEVAQLLGVSNGTVRRWDRTGKIYCFRTAGGQRRIPESVVEYLQSLRKKDFPNLPKPPIKTKASPVIKEASPVPSNPIPSNPVPSNPVPVKRSLFDDIVSFLW